MSKVVLIENIEQLNYLLDLKDQVDCFIALNGGMKSSKSIWYDKDTNKYTILNEIDDSEDVLTEEELFLEDKTLIGAAMLTKNLVLYGYMLESINFVKYNNFKNKEGKMKTNEDKNNIFDNPDFKKYLEDLIDLGKKGFMVNDGVMFTKVGLESIKYLYESEGKDLKEINFPKIGKLKISKVIEADEKTPEKLVEVRCDEVDLTMLMRHDDATETYLQLIYREGVNPPKDFEVIK